MQQGATNNTVDWVDVNTPEDPPTSPLIDTMREKSPFLGMMVNQLLSSPEITRFNTDSCSDSMIVEEFKHIELDVEQQSMCPSNTRRFDSDKVACSRGLFFGSKYYKAFGSESSSGMDWNDLSVMISGNHQNDICYASSEGSGLALSSGASISISPTNEYDVEIKKNVSTNLQTQRRVAEVPLQFENAKRCWKSNSHWQNHVRGEQMATKNKEGRRVRRNRFQRWSKQSSTTSNENKISSADNITPSLSIGLNKRNLKKVYRNSLSREICDNKFTLGDALKMLMTKENTLVAFVTDQEGSRFIQENLGSATAEQLWSTFNHLKRDFVTISQDVYGNYVAQKYLELGSDELRSAILEALLPNISSLSVQLYGCHVVQKLLACGAWEHKSLVAKQFIGSIMNFVYDQNGNHVIQKLIECLNPKEIGFVADEISGYTYSLAMHPYGSRVIQRLLTRVCRKKAQPLLNEIKPHTIALSKNQYGNWIIQWIVKHFVLERGEVVAQLIGHVDELSRDKFASNVIEQVLKRSSQAHISALAEELLEDDSSQTNRCPKLVTLVNNQFGNYVMQTLLDSSSEEFRQRLLAALSKCGQLEKVHGTNLLHKVVQMLRRNRNKFNVKR